MQKNIKEKKTYCLLNNNSENNIANYIYEKYKIPIIDLCAIPGSKSLKNDLISSCDVCVFIDDDSSDKLIEQLKIALKNHKEFCGYNMQSKTIVDLSLEYIKNIVNNYKEIYKDNNIKVSTSKDNIIVNYFDSQFIFSKVKNDIKKNELSKNLEDHNLSFEEIMNLRYVYLSESLPYEEVQRLSDNNISFLVGKADQLRIQCEPDNGEIQFLYMNKYCVFILYTIIKSRFNYDLIEKNFHFNFTPIRYHYDRDRDTTFMNYYIDNNGLYHDDDFKFITLEWDNTVKVLSIYKEDVTIRLNEYETYCLEKFLENKFD